MRLSAARDSTASLGSDAAHRIARLVARGLDAASIAERLVISPWTVQDHLKAAFVKADTRSRRDLLCQVFSQIGKGCDSQTG